MIVLIGGEKGGTGKATLATNLVAQRAQAGHDVLLVDTDRQGSASSWTQVWDASGRKLQVTCVQECGKGLQTAMRDLARRYEDVSINAGGRDSVELRAGLVLADKASLPYRPRNATSGPSIIGTNSVPLPSHATLICAPV